MVTSGFFLILWPQSAMAIPYLEKKIKENTIFFRIEVEKEIKNYVLQSNSEKIFPKIEIVPNLMTFEELWALANG